MGRGVFPLSRKHNYAFFTASIFKPQPCQQQKYKHCSDLSSHQDFWRKYSSGKIHLGPGYWWCEYLFFSQTLWEIPLPQLWKSALKWSLQITFFKMLVKEPIQHTPCMPGKHTELEGFLLRFHFLFPKENLDLSRKGRNCLSPLWIPEKLLEKGSPGKLAIVMLKMREINTAREVLLACINNRVF